MENIAGASPFTQLEKISEIIFDKGSYLLEFQEERLKSTITQVKNLMIDQDRRDESSINLFYSWAGHDGGVLVQKGLVPFSAQKFEQPNLLFVTNTPTDDALNKTLKIILRLLPILGLNLLLIVVSILKLERLDIR